MAPRKPTPAATGTALVDWEAEMARDAQVAAKAEANAGGGDFFSLKGGILTFGGAAIEGNQMAAIIVDSVFENAFNDEKYDPDNPQPPKCFAFARAEEDLGPHDVVREAGNAQNGEAEDPAFCKGCPWNEWGSADTGRGKACKNTRRLGLIPAGKIHPKTGEFELGDEAYLRDSGLGILRIPVTSVKPYATYVKQLQGVYSRPPYGFVTLIKVVPDAATQFKVHFEPLEPLPLPLIPMIKQRQKEAESVLFAPYPVPAEAPPPPARGRGRAAPASAKATAGKSAPARGRKY